MILEMAKINQEDHINHILKEYCDGGDRSIQAIFRHGVYITSHLWFCKISQGFEFLANYLSLPFMSSETFDTHKTAL